MITEHVIVRLLVDRHPSPAGSLATVLIDHGGTYTIEVHADEPNVIEVEAGEIEALTIKPRP